MKCYYICYHKLIDYQEVWKDNMKKIISIALMLALVLSFTACGSKEKDQPTSQTVSQTETAEQTDAQTDKNGKKVLIVYFSWSGNTHTVAEYIHNTAGGTMARIIPENDYASDYDTVVDVAKQEKKDNVRPKFKDLGVNPEEYDVIFIGYPIWWYTLPMIMYTFFDTYDLSGKTIIPFNTHEGSDDSGTYKTIQELEPNATVLDGLAIRGNEVSTAEEQVKEWLSGLKY